jgi:hypothetical protein
MGRQIKFPDGLFESGDRDDIANREVADLLAALPRDHLARRAFARGRTTVEITHHLRNRRDLADRLMNACWDSYRRKKLRAVRNLHR